MTYTNHFEMLDITLDSEDHIFRDDGYVPDMAEHEKRIYKEFGVKYTDTGYSKGVVGRTNHVYRYLPPNYQIIYYLDQYNPVLNVFTRAHEETHALHAIGGLSKLEEKLEKSEALTVVKRLSDFKKCVLEERELIANIGSCYALQRMNLFTPRSVTQISNKCGNSFFRASLLFIINLEKLKVKIKK